MVMDAEMDHGPVVKNEKLKIKSDDTYTSLAKRLANLSAKLLVEVLPKYISGEIEPREQNHDNATFCKIIKKQDGKIDWHKPAEEIYNMWRAFIEWPGIYTEALKHKNTRTLKIIELKLSNLKNNKLKPGTFFVQDKKLYVTCGNESVLKIKKIQPQGKKIIDANAFINGYLQ